MTTRAPVRALPASAWLLLGLLLLALLACGAGSPAARADDAPPAVRSPQPPAVPAPSASAEAPTPPLKGPPPLNAPPPSEPRPLERRWIDVEAPDRAARPGSVPCVPLVATPSCPCAPRDPCDDPRRGPIEWHDDFILAHSRLTLTPISPDTLGCGRSSLHVGLAWSNSFGWRQDVAGNDPAVRYFLIDGETRTFDVTATHGVSKDVDVALRLPLKWRGAGVLDSFIDAFHEAGSFLGFKDNFRSSFENDQYFVEGTLENGSTFDASDETGIGLGDVEASAKWRFVDGGRDGVSFAVKGIVTAPTGTAPFDVGGVNAGLEVAGVRRVGRAFDVYAGVGGTWFSETRYDGVGYEPVRGYAFVAIEWRPGSTWSFFVETDAATALISDIQLYDNEQWYLSFGAKIDLNASMRLELGFTENLQSQQTTADFGMQFGLEYRW